MPLTDLPEGRASEARGLPKNGYVRTAVYEYLRACERFGAMPWGGPEKWTGAEAAVVAEFCRVREMEEAK